MDRNVGKMDQIVRIALGGVLIIVGFLGTLPASWLKWVLIVVGIVLLITGAVGRCGLYKLIGVNTCKVSDQPPE